MIRNTASLILLGLIVSLTASGASAQNLLTNSNFDKDLAGWTSSPSSAATWDPLDVSGSPTSGSARIVGSSGGQGSLSQCVTVTTGLTYALVVNMRVPPGQPGPGIAFFGYNLYTGAGCTGAINGGETTKGLASTESWVTGAILDAKEFSGTVAKTARISLYVNSSAGSSFSANFDSIIFAPRDSLAKRLVIPVAASVKGANNSAFRSDVWLFNESTTNPIPVTMTLYCYANSPCTTVQRSVTIQPRQSLQIKDIVTTRFNQPQVGGAVEFEYDTFLGVLAATSRLYSPDSGPSYGFAMVARPSSEGLRRVVFPGLGWNGGVLTSGFRTNLGYYNPNATAANITVTLRRADGTLLGTTSASLPPRTAQQIGNLFGAVGAGGVVATDAYATVLSDIGVFTYASIIDNNSNDASYVEGIFDTGS